MVRYSIIFAIATAAVVTAVPLNINLGAYSPALVVGDGEISFGGAQSAGELMSTLASGAATAGNAPGAAGQPGQAGQPGEAGGQAPAPAAPQPAAPQPAAEGQQGQLATSPITATPQANTIQSSTSSTTDILTNNVDTSKSVDLPDTPAPVAEMIGKGMDPAFRPLIKRPNMERRSPSTEPLESRLAPSSSSPSSSSTTSSSSSTASKLLARDIAGFREALNYAREAMKNQPEVELGTGAEGA
ncbi:hypothetical protein LTS18_014791, partial [Coniosporium uncinatum]